LIIADTLYKDHRYQYIKAYRREIEGEREREGEGEGEGEERGREGGGWK
jgi:hypothetical protein